MNLTTGMEHPRRRQRVETVRPRSANGWPLSSGEYRVAMGFGRSDSRFAVDRCSCKFSIRPERIRQGYGVQPTGPTLAPSSSMRRSARTPATSLTNVGPPSAICARKPPASAAIHDGHLRLGRRYGSGTSFGHSSHIRPSWRIRPASRPAVSPKPQK